MPAAAQSQREMSAKAHQKFELAEAQLNQAYQKLLERSDEASKERLKNAQKAWLSFVGLHMKFIFPLKEGENPKEVYGTSYPMKYAIIKTELYRNRIKQLSVF